jgi:hypothetical protein
MTAGNDLVGPDANAVELLSRHPDQRDQLVAD